MYGKATHTVVHHVVHDWLQHPSSFHPPVMDGFLTSVKEIFLICNLFFILLFLKFNNLSFIQRQFLALLQRENSKLAREKGYAID